MLEEEKSIEIEAARRLLSKITNDYYAYHHANFTTLVAIRAAIAKEFGEGCDAYKSVQQALELDQKWFAERMNF